MATDGVSMAPTGANTKLQELALAHADEGALQDINHSNTLSTSVEKVEEGYFMSIRLIGAIISLGTAVAVSYWGFAPPAAVLTVINADIGPSNNASLFSIIWTISCGIGSLLFGRISDKFGRRWFIIGASSIALVGGIIAATAKGMNTLIGANVLMGLAAGVHTCYGLTVGEICPNRFKFVGVAFACLPNIISTGFGQYLGMTLPRSSTMALTAYLALRIVHYYNWRYIYYIFIPLMVFVLVMQVVFYRPPNFEQLHRGTRTRMGELKRVDFLGCFLIVAGLVLFLLGVSWGGQPLSWTSGTILGLIITGGCVVIIFVFWEAYGPHPNPIVPVHFFKDLRGFVCLIIIESVAGTSYVALSIIWPSQVARLYSSPTTSWQTTAWLSTTIALAIYSSIVCWGALVAILKHIRLQLIFLMSVMLAFLGSMASCNPQSLARSAVLSVFAAFPAGILEIMPGLLVQMDTNDADLGTTFSILYAMRPIVGAIMTAIYLAVLSSKTTSKLSAYIPPVAVKAGLPEGSVPALLEAIVIGTPAAMQKVPGITTTIQAAVAAELPYAYAAAYAYVYYSAVAVAGVGLIACFCVKDYDPYLTNHVPRQIYKLGDEKVGSGESEKQHPEVWEHEDVEKRPAENVGPVNAGEITTTRSP
ncbi:hypothetical protein CLAIMM_13818 [Cladophialophora immunda]|nr:hypothetical protein CLAIMM_13818 [Cladophialophora immunda]